MNTLRPLRFAAAVLAWAPVADAAPIPLVEDGNSAFVIYHAPDAPPSLVQAADDLQRYLHQATGARLRIVHDPIEPMICLGDNATARAAGLDVSGMPPEGFRMLTAGDNLYLAGPDTARDEHTLQGGTSSGTANGVYSFLERFVGVRWLDPTDHGDYVPRGANLTLPDTDLSDAPGFLNRRLPYIQERRPEVIRWQARQKLGVSLSLNHAHNWRRTVPPDLFDAHPDWFAERDGQRVPPTGRYKLCVTHPELIAWYARQAGDFFDRNPAATCYSLSPSDSGGWCECVHCTDLYEKDPNGNRSVTPAILSFYNAVAKRVAASHPDKLLAGYVYAAYVFPPAAAIPIEPNVFLVWAPSFDYGFTLHRPELRDQWEGLLQQWTRCTENLSYYDLPVNIETEIGALNPPGVEILSFLYPRLKQAGVKGVYVYGTEAWGRGAPLNYLLAKLAWNPDAEVSALLTEYCRCAYAEGAPEIERLWRLLDAEVARHFIQFPAARYTLTTDMMTDIYVRNLPKIERLYRAAEARITDEDARKRLEMIGANLTVLVWNLRQFGLLPRSVTTCFDLGDAEFHAFLSARRGSLALSPQQETRAARKLAGSVVVAPAPVLPDSGSVRRGVLRGDQHAVIYPAGSDPVSIRFDSIKARGKLVTWTVLGADGAEIADGLMSADHVIELDAEGSAHYHLLISGGAASFRMTVTGGAWGLDATLTDQGLHYQGAVSPVWFEVPAGTGSFHLALGAEPPGETAAAMLFAPDGRAVEAFDCSRLPLDRKRIELMPGEAGWWKLVITNAPVGALDDVWVQPGPELSGFLSLDPAASLAVRRLR